MPTVVLRDITTADLPIFFEHEQHPEANRLAAVPARDRDSFMTYWHTKVLADPDVKKKAIVVGGDLAGNIESWESDGRRFIGYRLGAAYWNRGIATTALAKFLADFETARPIYAFVAGAKEAQTTGLHHSPLAYVATPRLTTAASRNRRSLGCFRMPPQP